jgi:hypothetical protein
MSMQEPLQPPPASLSVPGPPPPVQQQTTSSAGSGSGPQLLLQQPYRYPNDVSTEESYTSQRRSEDTDESSLSSLDANSPQPQKRMAGLMAKMAHMGTQLANAAAAASAPDVSKQNVKNAKTKKDILDTGTVAGVRKTEIRVKPSVLKKSHGLISRCRISRGNSLSGTFEKKADRHDIIIAKGKLHNGTFVHIHTRDVWCSTSFFFLCNFRISGFTTYAERKVGQG